MTINYQFQCIAPILIKEIHNYFFLRIYKNKYELSENICNFARKKKIFLGCNCGHWFPRKMQKKRKNENSLFFILIKYNEELLDN